MRGGVVVVAVLLVEVEGDNEFGWDGRNGTF
jgi:hypothetical protein